MFAVDWILLVGTLLVLVGIASSRLASRIGLPVLVLFIAVGMLAGVEGIGGIRFGDYPLAHALGTVALAVILFDGGLRTDAEKLRAGLAPAISLATVGVLVTAGVTGAAAVLFLGMSPLVGLLLGSIVASTDAAAVFAVLRSTGLRLSGRLEATLEIESGSNDPMAVFLTVTLLEILLSGGDPGAGLVVRFLLQLVIGAVAGLAVGRLTGAVLGRLDLSAPGLYPVFTAAAGLFAYGLAATTGGSGFLAVYLAGIVLGRGRLVFRRGILLFHDGAAWLGQVSMFLLLGLVSSPSGLIASAGPSLALAAVLTLVARPVAVLVGLLPFRFSPRELAFVSWAGLKGAVPIVLATYPLLLGLPRAQELFDIVFFVVLLSAVTQGWSLPLLARKLGLHRPGLPPPPVELEITSLRDLHGDIVQYGVRGDSALAGRPIRDLPLPEDAVVAMIARGDRMIPPRGSTRLEHGDHVFLVLTPEAREAVDALFSGRVIEETDRAEFPIPVHLTVDELAGLYGLDRPDVDPEAPLGRFLRERLGDRLAPGRGVDLGDAKLVVREVDPRGEVTALTLYIPLPRSD